MTAVAAHQRIGEVAGSSAGGSSTGEAPGRRRRRCRRQLDWRRPAHPLFPVGGPRGQPPRPAGSNSVAVITTAPRRDGFQPSGQHRQSSGCQPGRRSRQSDPGRVSRTVPTRREHAFSVAPSRPCRKKPRSRVVAQRIPVMYGAVAGRSPGQRRSPLWEAIDASSCRCSPAQAGTTRSVGQRYENTTSPPDRTAVHAGPRRQRCCEGVPARLGCQRSFRGFLR